MKLTIEQQKKLVADSTFFVKYMSYDNYGLIGKTPTIEEFFNLKKDEFEHLI